MTNKKAKKISNVRISLRLSPELHTQLQELAQRNRRSLHGQIVWLLETTLAAREEVGAPSG